MRRRGRGGEAGVSVIEVVLLSPLVVGFVMVLVCFGVLVDAQGRVEGAARDAARSGSLQRDDVSANRAADAAARADLGTMCTGGLALAQIDPGTKAGSSAFNPGDLYTVRVSCTVSLAGLDWFSLGAKTLAVQATAPLDTFRRSG